MPKLLIFDAFTLLIPEKTVANYALLWCKTFSLKIWLSKILDKYHVCSTTGLNVYFCILVLLSPIILTDSGKLLLHKKISASGF